MLNINPFYKTGNIKFRGTAQNPAQSDGNKQVQNNEISNITPDYKVSTPISYKKLEEIDLPLIQKLICISLLTVKKLR